jgi:hypothetical protein
MKIDLDMFCALMLNRVGGEIHRTDIVTVDDSGTAGWTVKLRRWRIQQDSSMLLATARYSASALDRETVGCRLLDQETRFWPRKTQNPEVDRRVSGHPAQSASL